MANSVLDLTNSHLRDLSTVELSPGLTGCYVLSSNRRICTWLQSLDLTANRLETLEPALLALTALRTLNLRQNILKDASDLNNAEFKSTLVDLELRDNLLKEIRSLAPLTSLSLEPAATPPLRELYCAANKVAVVEGLSAFTGLTLLELGSNRVRKIEGLESNAELVELWLGRNRISQIQNLEHLGHLQRMSLQSNRLESMAGLSMCTALVELYLSHNGIWVLDNGLTKLTRLKVLDVSNNRISKVEHLQGLTQLQDLWLNDNQIPSLEGIEDALSDQKDSLTTIYLENNPAAAAADYKQRILALFLNLTQLDADDLDLQQANVQAGSKADGVEGASA